MHVLLTGGTGFLGSHVAEALVLGGHRVRATVRRASGTQHLEQLGAQLAPVSLETGDGLLDAFDGIDAVIHCAGGGQVASPEQFDRQNVLPTARLLDAARAVRTPLRRFVFASSIAAAPGATSRPADEGNRHDPPARSAYGAAKRKAEDLVLAAAATLPSTIVRLPALYGPRDTRWLPAFTAARRGVTAVLGAGHTMSVLYATDAASAMIAPLGKSHASGRIYAPNDGTGVTQRQLGRCIASALERKTIELRVPPAALRAAATAAEWSSKLTKRKIFLTRDKVEDLLFDGWTSDSGPMRTELDWQSRVGLDEGARLTAAWYRAEGLL